LKTLLEFSTPRQVRRFVVLTIARSLAGLLDLVALGLLWFVTSSVVAGAFSEISVLGYQLLDSARISEWRVSVYALIIVLLFVAKGLFAVILLRQLGKLTIELEQETAKRVVRASLSDVKLTDAKTRSDIVGTVHAIESGGQWAKGVVFGYAVAISESILVIALLVAMFIASPIMSLVLLVVLGGAAALLNIYLTREIRKLSKIQMASSKEMKSNLSAAVSSKLQIRLTGRVEEWEAGIAGGVRNTSTASTTVYLLRSMPRYVMEIAILFSVAAVGAISLLAGDLGDNVPGAAVILAGAFRIAGALLPLQGALNLVSHSNQLGSDFFAFVSPPSETRSENVELQRKLSTAIGTFASSDRRILLITGESGIGKSTSLAALLLDSSDKLGLPSNLGFGGQRATLLPGGAIRNISLQFEPEGPGVLEGDIEKLVEILGMTEPLARLERLGSTDLEVFSGGELTRLEILRAHFGNPSVVVLDEPSAGLDPKLVESLASYMNSSAARYIVISHDKTFASLLRDAETFDLKIG
jgi:ATP-binding cassette, subfamily B, bacterial PglK